MFEEFTVKVSDYQEFMDSLPTGSVDLILTDPHTVLAKKLDFRML